MTAPRWLRRAAAVTLALTTLAAIAALGARTATASAPPPCPPGTTCLTRVLITDGATGMNAPFYIEDNEGHPPGWNAAMFWVDGFQAGSVNPVCADATIPYAAHQACLGGTTLNATGGHPVLGLCLVMGKADCARWAVLTAGDIAFIRQLRAAGITVAKLRLALSRLGIR